MRTFETCIKGCHSTHLYDAPGAKQCVVDFGDVADGRIVVASITHTGDARFDLPCSRDTERGCCDPCSLDAFHLLGLAHLVRSYGDERLAHLMTQALEAISPETLRRWEMASR